MANEGAEAFLRAEEEAHRLVDELSKLKRETESYSTARTALQGATSGIAKLTDSVAGAAQGLEEVVKTLRSIGTPELLKAQEATTRELASLRTQAARIHRAMFWIGSLVVVGLGGLTIAFLLARGG